MTVLHIISKADISLDHALKAEHGILLIEDGVYVLLKSFPTLTKNIFVLETDRIARGLGNKTLPSSVKSINYAEFVKLTIEYKKTISW